MITPAYEYIDEETLLIYDVVRDYYSSTCGRLRASILYQDFIWINVPGTIYWYLYRVPDYTDHISMYNEHDSKRFRLLLVLVNVFLHFSNKFLKTKNRE